MAALTIDSGFRLRKSLSFAVVWLLLVLLLANRHGQATEFSGQSNEQNST